MEKQRQLERYLDLGRGACLLRKPRIAEMVQGALWHDDGLKYRLLAWVVMPNHVHALVEVWQMPLGKLVQAWKGYTGKAANRLLRREVPFWEEDYFDRYIRDEEHFRRVVRYIENNPVKAGLVQAAEEWEWSSARFRNREVRSGQPLMNPTSGRRLEQAG